MDFANLNWTDILFKTVAVIVILIVTAVVAALVKKGLRALLSKVAVLNRHPDSGRTLADSLATIAAMLVWLVGLMAILNVFNLTGVLTPINGLLVGFLDALPRIIGAGLVLFIGLTLAKVVKELVTTALEAAGADRWMQRISGRVDAQLRSDGVRSEPAFPETDAPARYGTHASAPASNATTVPKVKIATIAGQVVFALIAIVVSISALDILNIRAISDPATQMLRLILDAVPLVIAAGILLAIGVVVARFAAGLLEALLRGMGVDQALAKIGIDTQGTDVVAIITRVVQIAIVLFFAVAATGVLGFPALTAMLNTILEIAGRVVFGAVVIAAGVFLAQLLASLLHGQTATIVRYATIILFVAIGLKFMGLADSIVNLAFGALVVGGAAAAALAFGLGGRAAAARQLDKLQRDAALAPSAPVPATVTPAPVAAHSPLDTPDLYRGSADDGTAGLGWSDPTRL